jgi:hypothetical protein
MWLLSRQRDRAPDCGGAHSHNDDTKCLVVDR